MSNLFKFRGYYEDEKRFISGYHYSTKGNHYIFENIDEHTYNHYLVTPESLSIYTGQADKNNTDIFASFELDGVMTKGGDVCEHYYIFYNVKFDTKQGTFYLEGIGERPLPTGEYTKVSNELLANENKYIEIIGNQYEGGSHES